MTLKPCEQTSLLLYWLRKIHCDVEDSEYYPRGVEIDTEDSRQLLDRVKVRHQVAAKRSAAQLIVAYLFLNTTTATLMGRPRLYNTPEEKQAANRLKSKKHYEA